MSDENGITMIGEICSNRSFVVSSPHPLEFLIMVENIAPELKGPMRDVLSPQGNCAVARSANFTFIVCNALRGFTPLEISEVLEKDKRELVSPSVIRDYILKFIPGELIRPNLMVKWLTQTGKLDEVAVLESATRMQLSKVASQMDKPTLTDEQREGARRDLELLVRSAQASLDAKIKTGRVYSLPQQHEHKHVVEGKVEHTAKAEKLEPRQAARVLDALERIKQVSSGDN